MGERPFFDCGGRDAGSRNVALYLFVFPVENTHAIARDDDPVAFFVVCDPLRQRFERERFVSQICLALTISDYERRADPGSVLLIGFLSIFFFSPIVTPHLFCCSPFFTSFPYSLFLFLLF